MGGEQQVFNGVFVEHPTIIAKRLCRPKTHQKLTFHHLDRNLNLLSAINNFLFFQNGVQKVNHHQR